MVGLRDTVTKVVAEAFRVHAHELKAIDDRDVGLAIERLQALCVTMLCEELGKTDWFALEETQMEPQIVDTRVALVLRTSAGTELNRVVVDCNDYDAELDPVAIQRLPNVLYDLIYVGLNIGDTITVESVIPPVMAME